MACEINIKVNGEVIFTAHNDMELDGWISSHQALLSSGLEVGFNKIYSLDSIEETLKKMDQVDKDYKAFKEHKGDKDNVSVGTTTLWSLFGGLVDKSNPLFVFNGTIKDHPVKPTDVGNDVDEICNSYFKKKATKPLMYATDANKVFIERTIETKIMPELKRRGIKISDRTRQIFVQKQMMTRSMNDDFLRVIKESPKEFVSSDNIKKAAKDISVIEGIADLMIIDDSGVVHLIDFKTWEGDELNPVSQNKYFAQLTTYQEILRSYGIPIGQAFIVGFNTEYYDDDNGLHVGLKNIYFRDENIIRVPEGNKYVNAVKDALWKNTSVTDNTISDLGKVLTDLFPNTKIANRLQAREIDYKFMVTNAIREVDKAKDPDAWNKGYRFYFWKNRSITGEPKSEKVYAKTIKELTEDIIDETGKVIKAPFKAYFEQVAKKKTDRFKDFGKNLMYAMSIHSMEDFEESIAWIAPSNTDTLLHHFKRYILCNWKFKENEALNANGIYLFEKGDKLEIVVLDEENLINGKVDLLHGTSILGNFVKDSKGTDSRTIMSNDYGNLMLMKACALLALDPELTANKKVSNIKALNLHNARVYEENANRLISSWNLLAQHYNEAYPEKKKLRTLGYHTFMDDAKALMDIADEYIELLFRKDSDTYRNLVKSRETDLELTRETVLDRINALQNADRQLKDLRSGNYKNNDSWTAYAYLRRVLLYLEGINIFQEKDLGAVLQGINMTGIKMRSFNDSNSALARQMGELMSRFRTAIRLQFVDEQFKWSKLIDAAYKEEGSASSFIGNDWKFFESWFEQDKNGNIDRSFRLLRPEQFGKNHGPAAIKAYEYFLETNARYRWPNEERREEMRGTNEWYEVPMLKAGFIEHFTSGKPLAAVRSSWEKYKEASIGMIMGNPDVERTRKEFENIDVDSLPNVIDKDADERENFVTKQGVEGLERNLDFVFLSMLYSGIRSERSPLFCELFTSFLVVTDYMMDSSGLDIQTIRKAMTEFVQSKLFSRDIRPTEEKNLNALIGLLKSITAKVALGWNTRAFFREILTGEKKHLNRWIAGAEKSNPFIKGTKKWFEAPEFLEYSNFVEAYVDVVAKIFDNASIFGLYSQLNMIYGMVNFSNEEMADAAKRHQWTVLGISDKSSVTATAPDFLHRMAILVGHLKTIGAFDAYYLDEETGRLMYDMHKDSRFQTWLKYKDNEDSIHDLEERRKFNLEKQMYQEELESWNNIEFGLQYGDLLPQALSPRAAATVKAYADQQYGNYDEETKSLIQKQTLGSLFFQYKTYGLAQFALWFAEPGYTNKLFFLNVLDNQGRRIVQIPTKTQEEYGKHGDFIEKPENEVTEEEWKRPGTKYKRQLGGDLFIGKAQTSVLLASKLFTLNGEEFLDLWNSSPEFRTNLYLSMLDLMEFALIGLLLRLLWGTDETPIYKQNFIERWTYGVISGMSTDGPLFQTLQGITGDGTPPVFGMVKNYYRTMHSIITGNQNLLYGLTNTVGMTRELSNLFRTK